MYRSKEVLNTMAKIAADAYLGKQKTVLNDSLKKIAKDEGLTPHQIEYVAAEANKTVWADLFKMDKTASYDFALAEPGLVIKELQLKESTGQIKEAQMDYLGSPVFNKTAVDKSVYGEFVTLSTDSASYDQVKLASHRGDLKRTMVSRMEKMAHLRDELSMEMIKTSTAIDNCRKAFIKEARTLVMETPFTDRGIAMDKIAEFVRSAGFKEVGKDLMAKLSHVVKSQGLIKQADLKAPEEYISDKLPARIINGRHQLYITIQTLHKLQEQELGLQRNYEIVDSSLPILKEKIREL